MTIHWCGTGLSSVPGLRNLIQKGNDVCVWNRTIKKAQNAVGDITGNIQSFNMTSLKGKLKEGDLIVSMLPTGWHVPLAKLAIEHKAHFISSSYITPEMQCIHKKAKNAGVCIVNEVGLDPGIDHLMAHILVNDYRMAPENSKDNILTFKSYCGGIPKNPNSFRYKFSWSPAGVLKALCASSKSIKNFSEFAVDRPWDAISSYNAPLPKSESFEVYPNRDSLPYIKQYNFEPSWKIKEFVRGTLRLNGWAKAWRHVFDELQTLSGSSAEARIQEMSSQLWAKNAYADEEPDRVVLCVGLKADNGFETRWHKTFVMDAWGDERGTAMARLVSFPVTFAVEAVLGSKLKPGVQAAPRDIELAKNWMKEIKVLVQHLEIVNQMKPFLTSASKA